MSNWLSRRNDFGELPDRLTRYVLAIAVLGPLASLGAWQLIPGSGESLPLALVLVLTVLASLAERFPIHLTHKTHINVSTAVYIAMFLTLPASTACLLILVASALAQLLRMTANHELGLSEPLFNTGQTALYTAVAAVAVSMVDINTALSWSVGNLNIVAGVVASIVLHLGNTLLVAGAAGRHLGTRTIRVWRKTVTMDLIPHAALTLVGFAAAEIGISAPLLIPTLVIPAVLVHLAVRESVQLTENVHEALAAMVDIVELRDPYTAGHSRRVAQTARLIARELGLTSEEADLIASAGQVHDIGKIAIDPAIILKPGKLTDDEWVQMKLHPVYSADVINRFASYPDGVPLVRGHHESIDGTGYPDGLKGDAIPIGARILAVADTFDAITSDRPYRSGMPVHRAVEILNDGREKQWDARVVDALIGILGRAGNDVPIYQRVQDTDQLTGTAA